MLPKFLFYFSHPHACSLITVESPYVMHKTVNFWSLRYQILYNSYIIVTNFVHFPGEMYEAPYRSLVGVSDMVHVLTKCMFTQLSVVPVAGSNSTRWCRAEHHFLTEQEQT